MKTVAKPDKPAVMTFMTAKMPIAGREVYSRSVMMLAVKDDTAKPKTSAETREICPTTTFVFEGRGPTRRGMGRVSIR